MHERNDNAKEGAFSARTDRSPVAQSNTRNTAPLKLRFIPIISVPAGGSDETNICRRWQTRLRRGVPSKFSAIRFSPIDLLETIERVFLERHFRR
jgi:hypothetical protein